MLDKPFITTLLSIILAAAVHAAAPDENVVITSGVEEYIFTKGKNGVEVRHSLTMEYQATRRAEKIQPHMFHSNIVTLDKVAGGKAQYRNANSPTVFHDDSKVCYLDIYLDRKDKKAKTQFKRTFTDGAHFTGMYPAEEYPVRSKRIIFRLPSTLPDITLVDRNFPSEGITRDDAVSPDGSRTITYTVTSLPEIPAEKNQPPLPSLLAHIMVRGYFPDCDSLYRYHQRLLDVDTVMPGIGATVAEITAGAAGRDEIIDRLYRHVQQNIRYVAYEEGEAAYRPDTPAEVVRKRYGDCKGMSLLLATLLNRAGIEAYIACVGTADIPFRISESPSLSATNHMICIVPDGASYLFLDPTHRQISARHIPQWISGKDAMMFTTDGYRMVDIPAASQLPSADILSYNYRLTPDGLAGIATRTCTEDMAESFMQAYSDVPAHHLNELLAKSLIPMQRASVMPDTIRYDTDTPGRIELSAPILNPTALTVADNVLYLDLNTASDMFTARIDTDDRTTDYEFPLKGRIVRRSAVVLPRGAKATLPQDFRLKACSADLSCTFSREGDLVTMEKVIDMHTSHLPLSEIAAWNKAVAAWKEACNQQIEVTL